MVHVLDRVVPAIVNRTNQNTLWWVFHVGTILAWMAAAALFVANAGPKLEGHYFPAIRTEHIAGSVELKDDRLCWGTHFEKYRNLTPEYFEYWVTGNGRIPVPVYMPGPN